MTLQGVEPAELLVNFCKVIGSWNQGVNRGLKMLERGWLKAYGRDVVALAEHLLTVRHHAVKFFCADSHAVSQSCLELSCFFYT